MLRQGITGAGGTERTAVPGGAGRHAGNGAGGDPRLYAPYGETVNSVGAGDSMVAGFLAGFMQCGDYYEAFRTGIAAGSATAFSEWIADEMLVRQLMQRIK